MAVLSEKIKRYDKQIHFLQAIVDVLKEEKYTRRVDLEKQLHRDLTKMEKNMLNYAFKCLFEQKRRAWRVCIETMFNLRDQIKKNDFDIQKTKSLAEGSSVE